MSETAFEDNLIFARRTRRIPSPSLQNGSIVYFLKWFMTFGSTETFWNLIWLSKLITTRIRTLFYQNWTWIFRKLIHQSVWVLLMDKHGKTLNVRGLLHFLCLICLLSVRSLIKQKFKLLANNLVEFLKTT